MSPFPASDLYPQATGLYPGDGSEVIPTVTTGAATHVDSTHETLAGIVNPNGLDTHYAFEYGLTTAYGSQTTTGLAGSGSSPVSVTRTALSLTPGALYHYRLIAWNGAGTAYGADGFFVAISAYKGDTAPSAAQLALHVELEDVSGRTFRWDANDPNPENRPLDISFRTQRGDGFADASVRLARRIDRDFPDLSLLQRLRIVDDSGFIAYEGRVSEFPRDLDSEGHSIVVAAAGYMSSAKDRTFSEIYRDPSLQAWGPPSNARKDDLLTAGASLSDPSMVTDPIAEVPVIETLHNSPWSLSSAESDAWYDAGPQCSIGRLFVAGTLLTWSTGNATHSVKAYLSDDDVATTTDVSADLDANSPFSATVTATGSRRFALLQDYYGAAVTGDSGVDYGTKWTAAVVYGSHGLTPTGTEPDAGLTASQMIADIAGRFCPQLDPSGVDDTSYPIRYAVYKAMTPYDAMLDLNRYHLWEISAWEGGRLEFSEPSPLDDWDWEVRLDDPGTTVSLQGDSVESGAYNGVVVTYDDFTGKENVITPEDDDRLSDSSEDNPANVWGLQRWTEPPGGKIAFPTTYEDAVQIGRAALGEASEVRAPGEIQVSGWIRDRRGNLQPAHRVRCGERVRIADHPNDKPRRIVDTSFSGGELKTLRMSTDNTTKRVEGLFDRLETARKAANLG